ncbi:MAG TPA: asparagine synthase (glutamine-hydrolyzing) [Vicinamibacterales bacterium]|nr:asparagine synthase (glutamine-hydrolyzing) [Vicinamibacterales bacterium]
MCGIAGLVDRSGRRPLPSGVLQRMADALAHRGPDDEGYMERDGLGMVNRRLSIVGLSDGRQPIANEDGSVIAVFNGELFDYPEVKHSLETKGHRFRTHCDAELIPHLWEEYQDGMFERLRGQFALALYDAPRRRLILARDRFGIIPLYWSRQRDCDGEWLLFASEIRGLLASQMVRPRPDLRGIDQVFHFFAVPGPATCFEDVRALQPGHYLSLDLEDIEGKPVREQAYWQMQFPQHGDEENTGNAQRTLDAFERVLLTAVEHRLRADVPVVCYLSGGVDSSVVTAMAARIRGEPTPTFTVQVNSRHFDESRKAAIVARHIGSRPFVVPVSRDDVVATYPELIRAAEAPVIDTASAATLMLAREVHRQGFKVALAGEGSDEWLAGYSWFKVHRLINVADALPGISLSRHVRRLLCSIVGVSSQGTDAILLPETVLGHHSAFHDVYGLMTAAKFAFFNDETLSLLKDHNPYLELNPNLERMRGWHPLNQSAYWASRIHLPGHLLSLKGDRPAMNSSVETRYPFLDENVFAFLAGLHPRWKLRGFRDKYILRVVGERYVPREIAWGRKVMFRAPLDSFFAGREAALPSFVNELLSDESLKKTGWFRPDQVQLWRKRMHDGRTIGFAQRTMIHLGMVGVLATQLWYHTFIESLADLPSGWQKPRCKSPASRPGDGAGSLSALATSLP